MKVLEQKKIDIELERLNMERDTIKLTHEKIKIQNNLERNKITLLRLEMFKERQTNKKLDPNVTDEYLNIHFPFPE